MIALVLLSANYFSLWLVKNLYTLSTNQMQTKTSHDVITSYLVVSMMCLILLWAVTAYRLLVTFSFVQNRFYMLGSNNIAWLECQQWIFMFQPIKYYISTVNIKVQVIDVYCYFLFPVSSARGDRVDLLLLDGILL